MISSKYPYVCFDMDGTLLETHLDIAASMNNVLKTYGLPEIPAEIQRGFRHYRLKPFVADVMEYIGEPSVEMAIKVYDAHCANYENFMLKKGKPFDGIKEVLTYLKNDNRIISILTGKPTRFAKEEIAHWLPGFEFDFLQGADVGDIKKPRKEFLDPFLEKFHPDLKDIVYIGDTINDYNFTQNANIDFLGALWGYDAGGELAASPARLCQNPIDLIGMI